MCLPYAALAVWLGYATGWQSVAAFLACAALILWLLAFVTRTWRRFFLLQWPLFVLCAAFAAYAIAYGTPPGQMLAYVLATSSWEEVRGFFSIWQGEQLLLAAVIVAGTDLVLALRCPPTAMASGRTGAMVRWGVIAAVLLLIAASAQNVAAFMQGMAANPLIGTGLFIAGPLQHAKELVNGTAIRKVPYGAARVDHEEVHILVIGESSRRDSWSAYGYSRQTTPYLDRLRDEVIFLRDAVADANITIYAVPILLTGVSPDHFDMDAIHGNLVDLAAEAGYSTAWLMNQDPHVSLLIGIHADLMLYPPSLSTLALGHLPLDQTLLPELRRELERNGKPRFIGLHTIGSHWQYDSRYPPSFQHFGTSGALSYFSVLSTKPDQRIVDTYDNSIAYTDWFLDQVIAEARKLTVPATVTYLSDHGEDLLVLDGRAGHGAPTYSQHQFDIPAFIWVNAAYRAAHADQVQALKANANKPVRTHDFFYTEADLMGINWPGAMPTKSFASTQFAPEPNMPVIAGASLVAIP
jgi:glucan phosphoethanolaminetransferase (alkaline phosphatase superfamily)